MRAYCDRAQQTAAAKHLEISNFMPRLLPGESNRDGPAIEANAQQSAEQALLKIWNTPVRRAV
jgi:hypothetical protein